ncbi:MAG: OsmC family protein [Phycisphaerales bacterium]|nr:OsmC family protein [Phycisphaerales bacterium]
MTTATAHLNGIDTDGIKQLVRTIKQDHRQGLADFRVATQWKHGMHSQTRVTGWGLGGKSLKHSFTIDIDEPRELCGQDQYANPQEYLLGAMNACMLNTFVAVCSLQGVELESLSFESEGQLDLRGFLGIDTSVKPGYGEIRYTIRVKGNGTPEQFRKAHEAMIATSPNYFNLANGIPLRANLIIED